jgi:transcriptional regulator with PAS, ATPase and Fis domain
VGESQALRGALAHIHRYARSKAPVLIIGETGTGKEVAAHALHYTSRRRDRAFIPVNCGALPDSLIESELFGHARGAFTDASRARSGLVREAEGGSLFLDEIESLSIRGQVVLLRFLQDASFRSIGEEQSRDADVRVIAASNVDLHQLVERGAFRADLLFRLDVLRIALPPLRERAGDVALLVPHLLEKAARMEGGGTKTVSPAALELLCAHHWPGNVRELEHVLLRAHLLCSSAIIDDRDLKQCCAVLNGVESRDGRTDCTELRLEKLRAVKEVERRFVESVMARTKGNISEAARLCNMERAALSRMVKKHRQRIDVLPSTLNC